VVSGSAVAVAVKQHPEGTGGSSAQQCVQLRVPELQQVTATPCSSRAWILLRGGREGRGQILLRGEVTPLEKG
jgi:hypothetical protein